MHNLAQSYGIPPETNAWGTAGPNEESAAYDWNHCILNPVEKPIRVCPEDQTCLLHPVGASGVVRRKPMSWTMVAGCCPWPRCWISARFMDGIERVNHFVPTFKNKHTPPCGVTLLQIVVQRCSAIVIHREGITNTLYVLNSYEGDRI